MKRIITIIIASLLALPALPQGVTFRPLGLEEALQQAGKEQKLLFVDCFTTWCSPCIYMTNNVFSRKEAGDFFNKHFVSIMIDMEQEGGAEINSRYAVVSSFPTYLILAPGGEEQYRIIGRHELPRFLERVSRGLDKKNALPVLEKEYAAGNMTDERIRDYLLALDDARRDVTLRQVFNKFVVHATIEEKTSPFFWPLLGNPRINPHSVENTRFVFDHLEVIQAGAGEEEVLAYLLDAYNTLLGTYLVNKIPVENPEEMTTLVREQLAARPLLANDTLRGKLEIAAALAGQRFEEAVTQFGKHLACFSLADFGMIMGIGNRLDRRDKELMNKVAAISLDGIADPGFKEAMKNYINYLVSN